MHANREKLLLLIFLALCFPAGEAAVFCLLQTGTNNDLPDGLTRRMSCFC